jgi:hypothetical protein
LFGRDNQKNEPGGEPGFYNVGELMGLLPFYSPAREGCYAEQAQIRVLSISR